MPSPDDAVHSSAPIRDVLTEAREAGFLGPGPIETQLEHAEGFAAIARRLDTDTTAPRILDLGSGGGVPGLVVATTWREPTLVLLESNRLRAEFLRRSVQRLGLQDRVSVLEERAEAAGREPDYRAAFDGVLARSFGRPAVVAECAAPLLSIGGWLVVSEPPPLEDETTAAEQAILGRDVRWPPEGLAQLGLEPAEVVREGASYQVLRQAEGCPERFPRRDGVPAKRPLF
ncbi:MAG TPA: RsmG family class I SAM-dependent methyltransferase [Acidimicrobiales bacterium]|nr:RsmG family class I SAM-dependent methyltransferase [Acidimicrobiales bacterium]